MTSTRFRETKIEHIHKHRTDSIYNNIVQLYQNKYLYLLYLNEYLYVDLDLDLN